MTLFLTADKFHSDLNAFFMTVLNYLRKILQKNHIDNLGSKLVEVASSIQHPFIQGTTDNISRILSRHKVVSTLRPLKTICGSLRSIKDLVDPKNMKGGYLIPCSYGTPYIG